MADNAAPFLDAEQAAFLCREVSISAASCGRNGLPNLARATGCRVSADRRRVTVLLAATPAAALLADVRRDGRLAVVFSLPESHRTLQLKAGDARIEALEADDAALARRYVDAFADGLEALGYPGPVLRALLAAEADDLVAVSFTPTSGSSQTPGPEAGTALRGGA